jgi:hypothetical protein
MAYGALVEVPVFIGAASTLDVAAPGNRQLGC